MQRLQRELAAFPRPFWVLFFGSTINSLGAGLVFPFLSLYLRQRLGAPMTTVGIIATIWSLAAFPGQLVGGELADRVGRRRMMVLSLLAGGLTTLGFGLAGTLPAFLVLALAAGLTGSAYGPAASAMVADLVGPEGRTRAYGLLRITSNFGYALGPALGGLIAGRSYLLLFTLSALASLLYGAIVFWGTYETKPRDADLAAQEREGPGGFLHVLRNGPFLLFCALAVAAELPYSQMTMILPVHMKENFGLAERYFGWVMTTNAGMVALLQYSVSRWAERRPRLRMMALGAALYGLGVGSVALARGFPWFLGSMVLVTFGEMISVPIASAVAADMAPPDLRGRYMAFFGLTWTAGYAIGPVLGGLMADHLSVRLLWPLMSMLGMVVTGGFLLLHRRMAGRFRAPAGAP